MKNKFIYIGIVCLISLISCRNETKDIVPYDLKLGIGAYNDSTDLILAETAESLHLGDSLYLNKCANCHHLTSKPTNGPGWEGITKRRTDIWLMNLLTNTEEMHEKDPTLKEAVKEFNMTMPDFQLTHKEASAIVLFMKRNDQGDVNRDVEYPEQCHVQNRR